MMTVEEPRIGNCGRTTDECWRFHEQGVSCGRFSTLDSDLDDTFNPSNCVYYQQHIDQLIEGDYRRNR